MARELKLFILFLFGLSMLVLWGYVSLHWADKDDAPMEEMVEELIKAQTGLEIDFSKESPE